MEKVVKEIEEISGKTVQFCRLYKGNIYEVLLEGVNLPQYFMIIPD